MCISRFCSKILTKSLLIFIAVFGFVLSKPLVIWGESNERIFFHSITMHAVSGMPGIVDVAELLRFETHSQKIKHGLIRTLPNKLNDDRVSRTLSYSSFNLKRFFEYKQNLSLLPEIKLETPKLKGSSYRVELGREDQSLSPGVYEYLFTYKISNLIYNHERRERTSFVVEGFNDFDPVPLEIIFYPPEKLIPTDIQVKSFVVTKESRLINTDGISSIVSRDDAIKNTLGEAVPVIRVKLAEGIKQGEFLKFEANWNEGYALPIPAKPTKPNIAVTPVKNATKKN